MLHAARARAGLDAHHALALRSSSHLPRARDPTTFCGRLPRRAREEPRVRGGLHGWPGVPRRVLFRRAEHVARGRGYRGGAGRGSVVHARADGGDVASHRVGRRTVLARAADVWQVSGGVHTCRSRWTPGDLGPDPGVVRVGGLRHAEGAR